MRIEWEKVVVGETEIVNRRIGKRTVLGIHGEWVWLKDEDDSIGYSSRHMDTLGSDWSIYDPWEEITEHCAWQPIHGHPGGWSIEHDGDNVLHDDVDYKTDGRRVWKRKELR